MKIQAKCIGFFCALMISCVSFASDTSAKPQNIPIMMNPVYPAYAPGFAAIIELFRKQETVRLIETKKS